jgi:hypothetical protein
MKYTPSIATWCGSAATILLTLALHTLPAGAADGNPPALMTYQSYLADANGVPLASTAPKNYDVIFRIYNDQSAIAAGNRLWTEQQTVTVDKGYFSVLLGEGSQVGSESRPAINTLFTGTDISDRFVEMTVKGIGAGGSDSTLKPRLRLMTSPYAFVSKYAIHAANLVNSTNAAVVNVSGGYVGINKLVPNAALDVTGAAAVSGSLSAGSATVSGSLSAGSATVSGALSAGSASISGALSANTLAVTSATVSGAVTAESFTGNGTIPIGGIIMWSGSVASIPTGWALCNGQTSNGKVTPNLQDRFVMGAGSSYAVNASAGNASVTLSANQLPAHNHQYKDGYHVEQDGYGTGLNGADVIPAGKGTQGSDSGNNLIWYRWLNSEINVTAGQAISTLPPYYALAFIMRVQ